MQQDGTDGPGARMGAGGLGRRFGADEIGLHDSMPSRLHRLAELPWHDCWMQQLRAEKKSEHTIRASGGAARGFAATRLPREPASDCPEVREIPVSSFHIRADPNNGRMDAWLNGLGELKPTTINAKIAAVSHLLKWLGHTIPDWIQRPSRSRSLPKQRKPQPPVTNTTNTIIDVGAVSDGSPTASVSYTHLTLPTKA